MFDLRLHRSREAPRSSPRCVDPTGDCSALDPDHAVFGSGVWDREGRTVAFEAEIMIDISKKTIKTFMEIKA